MSQANRILAFDPSTRNVGWAVLDASASGRPVRVASGVIEGKGGTLFGRYRSIRFQARTVFKKHNPTTAAFEEGIIFKDPVDPTKRSKANPHTALAQAEVRGILIGLALEVDIPFEKYMPSTVKKAATGNGKAKKGQVAMFVTAFFGMAYALEDEADALAVALAHANRLHERGLLGEGDLSTVR